MHNVRHALIAGMIQAFSRGRNFLHFVSAADLMSFDELSSTSEKLCHPTANRPKMPGRRLPAQFGGGQSVSKDSGTALFLMYDYHLLTSAVAWIIRYT